VEDRTMSEALFQSDRIALRPFEEEDVPALAAYLNHPDLTGRRYIPWSVPEIAPLSRKQVQGIVQKWGDAERALTLAIESRDHRDLLGHAECDWSWDPHCPSASVTVAPAHQRQGYGSEALSLVLCYLFKHTPAHVITCWIADWNESGLQFAAHHGFRQAGRLRRAGIRHGEYFDMIVSDLLRSEWGTAKS
jgi:RimJ/RimL family protein N-acetyltransferase